MIYSAKAGTSFHPRVPSWSSTQGEITRTPVAVKVVTSEK
jgi:hypothetical protein